MTNPIQVSDSVAIITLSQNEGVLVTQQASTPTQVAYNDRETTDYMPHGTDNLLPNNMYTDLKAAGVAARALATRRNLHFGKGLLPFELSEGQDNTITKKILFDPKIRQFMRATHASQKQIKHIQNLETYFISYIEVILNKGRDQIVSWKPFDPRHARLQLIQPTSGRSEKVYISGDFTDTTIVPTSVTLADMENPIHYIQKTRDYKYILCYKYDDGNPYYPNPIWNSLRESGWMDIIKAIPKIKKAIFDNQMILKYHIRISDLFLKSKWPKWGELSAAERKKNYDSLLAEIDTHLKGTTKSGKSLMSTTFLNERVGKEVNGLAIEPIKHEFNDGLYNIDTADANSQTLFTIGINPSLLGHGIPGGKEISGSGSDIRESLLVHRAQAEPDRIVSTEFWRFLSDFNRWGNLIDWGYTDLDTSQTLDKNPTGSRNVM